MPVVREWIIISKRKALSRAGLSGNKTGTDTRCKKRVQIRLILSVRVRKVNSCNPVKRRFLRNTNGAEIVGVFRTEMAAVPTG